MNRRPSTAFLVYLGALSATGVLVLYLATSRMGPGVSTDSAMIMATAENLLQDRGLVDYNGNELTQFPPLYSIIQAMGSAIFGLDVFVIGWMLNLLVFALLIWFTGLYLHDAFSEEPILAYFGSLVVLTSTSLIEISANIASDPLFMLMVVFFLRTAANYLRSGRIQDAVLAAMVTIVSCFQRYAGLSLVIAGSLIVLYAQRHNPRRAFLAAGLFGVITAAPIYAWGYLHNKPVNGTVFGGRLPPVPALNFSTGTEKILYWFIPHRIIDLIGPLPLAGILTAACVLAVVCTGKSRFLQKLGRAHVVPSIAFLLVYAAVLIFNISYYELKALETDRVHIVALPSLLVVLAAVGSQLIHFVKQNRDPARIYGALAAIFLVWLIYPTSRTNEYVRESMARGDVSRYNSINKGDVRRSDLAEYLHGLDLEGTQVYSNGVDTAWFILHRFIEQSPTLQTPERSTELLQDYAGWPGTDDQAYLVWIRAEAHKTFYASPEELALVAFLDPLYADENATVYSVRLR